MNESMTAKLPPFFWWYSDCISGWNENVCLFFSQCKTLNIFYFFKILQILHCQKNNLAKKLKFSGKCEIKIVVPTLTALLPETPEWAAALSGGLANKPIQ
jgi:hypothetical protein